MPALNTASTFSPAYPGATQNYFSQIRQSLSELAGALQSGDLPGAQTAFSPLYLLTQFASANDEGPSRSDGKRNQFCADLTAIGRALKTGDLGAAQAVLVKMQRTIHPAGLRQRQRAFGN
jgi:hypothetical protein